MTSPARGPRRSVFKHCTDNRSVTKISTRQTRGLSLQKPSAFKLRDVFSQMRDTNLPPLGSRRPAGQPPALSAGREIRRISSQPLRPEALGPHRTTIPRLRDSAAEFPTAGRTVKRERGGPGGSVLPAVVAAAESCRSCARDAEPTSKVVVGDDVRCPRGALLTRVPVRARRRRRRGHYLNPRSRRRPVAAAPRVT